jgi:hypothetical protein
VNKLKKAENLQNAEAEELTILTKRLNGVDAAIALQPDRIMTLKMEEARICVQRFEAVEIELPRSTRRSICILAASDAVRKAQVRESIACARTWGEAEDEEFWSELTCQLSSLPFEDDDDEADFAGICLKAFVSSGFLEWIQKGNVDTPVRLCAEYLKKMHLNQRSINMMHKVAMEAATLIGRIASVVRAVGDPEPLQGTISVADIEFVFPALEKRQPAGQKTDPRLCLLKDNEVCGKGCECFFVSICPRTDVPPLNCACKIYTQSRRVPCGWSRHPGLALTSDLVGRPGRARGREFGRHRYVVVCIGTSGGGNPGVTAGAKLGPFA